MEDADLKQRIQARFGRDALAYVTSPGHAMGKSLSRLAELAEPRTGLRALDVATGGGHTALALATRGARVTATDLTPAMLEAAREWCRGRGARDVDFACADAERLPFPDESFDRVTCRLAAHHFPRVEQAFVEMARVLRRGGVLLFVDNYAPADDELDAFVNRIEWLRDETHVRSHRVAEWRQFLERQGLTVEAEEDFPHDHGFAEWVGRSQTRPDCLASLVATIRGAPERVRSQLQVVLTEEGVESWVAPQVLLAARKAE